MYVIESEEADAYSSIDHDGSDLDEEDGGGFVGLGVTEEVEDMQKAVISSSLSSYMMKSSHLLTKGFENNSSAQEKIFKQIFNFGERSDWREGIIVVSYYLYVGTTKDKCRLINPMPLKFIVGFTIDDYVCDRALKKLPHRRLNFIDGYISDYCSIHNSLECLE